MVLQDECDFDKPPFSKYQNDLVASLGVEVIIKKLSGPDSRQDPIFLENQEFDFIVDNWSKNVQNATFTLGLANSCNVQQYVFISSGGVYEDSEMVPLKECSPVTENNARRVEKVIEESNISYTFIRPQVILTKYQMQPLEAIFFQIINWSILLISSFILILSYCTQYIYGPNSNKRHLDFFIGRAARKLPIPIPYHGDQLVSLTHVEDVCSLITCTIGNKKAENQAFNCATNRFITYRGLADSLHKALNNDENDVKYLYYNPGDFTHWESGGTMQFPFRKNTFIVSSNKAIIQLGWKARHDFVQDILGQVELYKSLNDAKKEWTMDELRYDLEIMASKDPKFMFTYPFFDGEDVNVESRPYFFEK